MPNYFSMRLNIISQVERAKDLDALRMPMHRECDRHLFSRYTIAVCRLSEDEGLGPGLPWHKIFGLLCMTGDCRL
jgi:hypothetical protein